MKNLNEAVDELKKLRTRYGVSQLEMSERTGIARKTISRLENGHDDPKLGTVLKMAEALDCTIEVKLIRKEEI